MQLTLNPRWDLDTLFPGGSESEQFQAYVDNIKDEMKGLSVMVEQFNPQEEDYESEFVQIIHKLETTVKKLREASAFVSCLSAQNVKDEKADILVGQRSVLSAEMGSITTKLDQKLIIIPDSSWEALLQLPELVDIAFVLDENRTEAK